MVLAHVPNTSYKSWHTSSNSSSSSLLCHTFFILSSIQLTPFSPTPIHPPLIHSFPSVHSLPHTQLPFFSLPLLTPLVTPQYFIPLTFVPFTPFFHTSHVVHFPLTSLQSFLFPVLFPLSPFLSRFTFRIPLLFFIPLTQPPVPFAVTLCYPYSVHHPSSLPPPLFTLHSSSLSCIP